MSRRCSKCGRGEDATFYPHRARCVECMRAYGREQARRYYLTHRGERQAAARARSRAVYQAMDWLDRRRRNRRQYLRWGQRRYRRLARAKWTYAPIEEPLRSIMAAQEAELQAFFASLDEGAKKDET